LFYSYCRFIYLFIYNLFFLLFIILLQTNKFSVSRLLLQMSLYDYSDDTFETKVESHDHKSSWLMEPLPDLFYQEENEEYEEYEEDEEDEEDDKIDIQVIRELKHIPFYNKDPIYSFLSLNNQETIFNEIMSLLEKDEILSYMDDIIEIDASETEYKIKCNYLSIYDECSSKCSLFKFDVNVFRDDSTNRQVVEFQRISGSFYGFLSFYEKFLSCLNTI
jgi:hypothetical protein